MTISNLSTKSPEKQALSGNGNGNGHHAQAFDPAAWQFMYDELVSKLPDEKTRRIFHDATTKVFSPNLKDASPDRFATYSAELALVQPPPIQHIVNPLFSIGSVSLIVAAAKKGKTWLVLHLLACLAAGFGNWLGFEAIQCPVLLIDEESGKPRTIRRLYAILRGLGIETPIPLHVSSLAGLRVLDIDDLFELRALIRRTGAKMVVIDALIDVIRDQAEGAENSSTTMSAALHPLRQIAEELECAFLILHHENKAGGYRGSTALEGEVDLLLTIKSERGSNRIELDTAAARDFKGITFAAEINFEPDRVTLTATEAKKAKAVTKSERGVLEWLNMTPGGHTLVDIGRGVEETLQYCKAKTAENAALELYKLDYLKRTTDAGILYEITDKGRAIL